jgi:hypothetical protein
MRIKLLDTLLEIIVDYFFYYQGLGLYKILKKAKLIKGEQWGAWGCLAAGMCVFIVFVSIFVWGLYECI